MVGRDDDKMSEQTDYQVSDKLQDESPKGQQMTGSVPYERVFVQYR